MKKLTTISNLPVVALAVLQSMPACFADETTKANHQIRQTKTDTVTFRFPWTPGALYDEVKDASTIACLEVRMLHEGNAQTMQIRKDNDVLFSLQPGLTPICMFPLDNYDCNLATLWKSGASERWTLLVFSYANGKVKQVLSANSLLLPEFVYQSKGVIRGERLKQTQIKGEWALHQAIIVSNDAWAHRNWQSVVVPISADIYTWDEHTAQYMKLKGVPWAERLKQL